MALPPSKQYLNGKLLLVLVQRFLDLENLSPLLQEPSGRGGMLKGGHHHFGPAHIDSMVDLLQYSKLYKCPQRAYF